MTTTGERRERCGGQRNDSRIAQYKHHRVTIKRWQWQSRASTSSNNSPQNKPQSKRHKVDQRRWRVVVVGGGAEGLVPLGGRRTRSGARGVVLITSLGPLMSNLLALDALRPSTRHSLVTERHNVVSLLSFTRRWSTRHAQPTPGSHTVQVLHTEHARNRCAARPTNNASDLCILKQRSVEWNRPARSSLPSSSSSRSESGKPLADRERIKEYSYSRQAADHLPLTQFIW